MTIAETNASFRGTCLSPGLADGPVLVLAGGDDGSCDEEDRRSDAAIAPRQVDAEHSMLDDAVEKATSDLLELAATVEREISAPLGQVFDAHRMIANDDSLRAEMRREITENLVGAGAAVRIVFGRWEERFQRMDSSIARSKSDDMADVSRRLHDALNKVFRHPLANIAPGCVLVRSRLLPSDTVFMVDRLPSAILLDHGTHGSHAALFVREMGLPCIVGCQGLRARVGAEKSVRALVDAGIGTVILAPSRSEVERFERKKRSAAKDELRMLRKAQAPALTRDGTRVAVMANIGSARDARRAADNGADGIGLFRIEQVYLGRLSPPDVAELVSIIRPILAPFRGKPICIRLLDAGGDKQVPFLQIRAEGNPALGRRGIRLLRAHPELLDTGLRALIELSREFPLSILIPMVSVPEDVTAVTTAVDRICTEEDCRRPPIGAMIEIPAAALMIDTLAPHLDFISFGTNDLTQHCFAADRDNASVEGYFRDEHEAIFRLMDIAIRGAPGMPASLCGELAANTHHTDRFVALGMTGLSVAPPFIAGVKEAVRGVSRRPKSRGSARSNANRDGDPADVANPVSV